MHKRVVITGIGLYSCLGTGKTEVLDSLRTGRSGIVLDEDGNQMGNEDDGDIFAAFDADGNVVVLDESKITTELVRLQAEYDAQEYARNRATEYPAIADQLDEIYHNGINAWKAVIKVTKDKYPKP